MWQLWQILAEKCSISLGASPNLDNNDIGLQQNLDIYDIKLFLQTDFLKMDIWTCPMGYTEANTCDKDHIVKIILQTNYNFFSNPQLENLFCWN